MNSPFKFLDAYTRKDRDIFFGREVESETLYELVNRNRLVLVYGQSGTGKTSLIQCGLGNKFDTTDWYPIFVRRGNNLNVSLKKELSRALEEDAGDDMVEALRDIYAENLRPVYLIFDQLEEIFVLGTETEQNTFIDTLAEINSAKLPCQVILSMREEYLGDLYPFEKLIPTLLDRRLRVEPMSDAKAEDVITRSCAAFNIEFEDPENAPAQIIDNVRTDRMGISLPYLQVYLDQFYREDFVRTYPGGNENHLPYLEFTNQEIEEFGKIDKVLRQFLEEQTRIIQKDGKAAFKERFSKNSVQKVLGKFASLSGTKVPLSKDQVKVKVSSLDPKQLDFLLVQLQKARILREKDGVYELTHDTLAEEIADNRGAKERDLLKISTLVSQRLDNEDYLSEKQLQLIGNLKARLKEEKKLTKKEWKFVAESQRRVDFRKRRTFLITSVGIGILLILLAVAGYQGIKATRANDKATAALKRVKIEQAATQKALLEAYDEQLKRLKSQIQESDRKQDIFRRAKEYDLEKKAQKETTAKKEELKRIELEIQKRKGELK